MTVKKAFAPFMDVIESNLNATVSDIADQLRALASTKARGNTAGTATSFIRDTSGTVVAIHDYYFKRWMPLVGDAAVEFGSKAGSSSGFNQMCKAGVSAWTKAQREAKAAGSELLALVASGEVAPHDIAARQAEIEAHSTEVPHIDLGFASREEVEDYLQSNGVTLA